MLAVLLGLSEDERITSNTRVRSASFLARLSEAPAREASKDCCMSGVMRCGGRAGAAEPCELMWFKAEELLDLTG